MSSLITSRSLCKICNKVPSVFLCQGCQKDFCMIHANEHRQSLSKQFETIMFEHVLLQGDLSECLKKSNHYSILKEIDQWETESINKIRQAADDARKQLLKISNSHTNKITNELKTLTKELTKARSEDNFIEIDLKHWMDKLQKCKMYFSKPPPIHIAREENDISFIQKIFISTNKSEFFERSIGNIKIEDNGQVIRNESEGYSTARFHCDYSTGHHRHRFNIEQIHRDKWMVFGIVSKNAPLQNTSYNTATNFGWTTHGYVLLNANGQQAYNGYKSDVEENDTIELFLDCDRRTIRLTNERTNSKHELNVDLNECPFPWQIHVGLYDRNDRVRYLPS